VWPNPPCPFLSCERTWAANSTQHMSRQGAWGGRVSTRTPLDCACTLQYLPRAA
jgi:hypothetical protein